MTREKEKTDQMASFIMVRRWRRRRQEHANYTVLSLILVYVHMLWSGTTKTRVVLGASRLPSATRNTLIYEEKIRKGGRATGDVVPLLCRQYLETRNSNRPGYLSAQTRKCPKQKTFWGEYSLFELFQRKAVTVVSNFNLLGTAPSPPLTIYEVD